MSARAFPAGAWFLVLGLLAASAPAFAQQAEPEQPLPDPAAFENGPDRWYFEARVAHRKGKHALARDKYRQVIEWRDADGKPHPRAAEARERAATLPEDKAAAEAESPGDIDLFVIDDASPDAAGAGDPDASTSPPGNAELFSLAGADDTAKPAAAEPAATGTDGDAATDTPKPEDDEEQLFLLDDRGAAADDPAAPDPSDSIFALEPQAEDAKPDGDTKLAAADDAAKLAEEDATKGLVEPPPLPERGSDLALRPDPFLPCFLRSGELYIDGKLTESAWYGAPPVDLTEFPWHNPIDGPRQRTQVRVLHDPTFLYVCIQAWDTDISGKIIGRDADGIDGDERVAIFIRPDAGRDEYLCFETNSLGTLLDYKVRFTVAAPGDAERSADEPPPGELLSGVVPDLADRGTDEQDAADDPTKPADDTQQDGSGKVAATDETTGPAGDTQSEGDAQRAAADGLPAAQPVVEIAGIEIDRAWNCAGAFVAARKSGGQILPDGRKAQRLYTVEMAIPLRSILGEGAQTPAAGDRWSVGLYRVDVNPRSLGGGTRLFAQWRPGTGRRPNFHRLESFGPMQFQGKGPGPRHKPETIIH